MSITCYAHQFEMQPHAGQTSRQCLAAVRNEAAGWVQEVYRQKGRARLALPFNGSQISPRAGHEIRADQEECATHQLATLDWEFADQRDPSLTWRFSCVVACDAQVVQAALVVQLASLAPALRPLHYRIDESNPLAAFKISLLAKLLNGWPCRIEGQPVPTEAQLLGADQIEAFINESLVNPGRVLPVIVLAPDGEAPPDDDALGYLLGRVVGFAQVTALADQPAVDRLTQLLGAERSCEGGVRIYWPGFTRDAPSSYHIFRNFAQIKADPCSLGQSLYQSLSVYSSDCFHEGRLIRAARAALAADRAARWRAAATAAGRLPEAEAELQEARGARERFRQERDAAWQQVAALRSELADVCGQLAALQDAARPELTPGEEGFGEFAAELERAWDENERLRAEGEAVWRRVAELEADLRNSRDNLARLWEAQGAPEVPPLSPAGEQPLGTVADALRAAAAEFADVLTVWEDATHSAEQSLFASPAQVFRALRAIAEVGRDYFKAQDNGPPLGPVDQAFRGRVPFKYTAFESQTTLSLFGADRVFHHGEQSRQMQRHLTLGGGQPNNCLQIYFEFDDEARRVLIGYCGRHLRFYRQRT